MPFMGKRRSGGLGQSGPRDLDRVLATYSQDGYYYEGFEYWIFSTPWLIHYVDAHAHATGEDLYDLPGFRDMHKYVAHSMLPTGSTCLILATSSKDH